MRKILFPLFLLIAVSAFSQAPQKAEKIFYIVDNVPIIDEPDENSGNVSNDDIEELIVVTDKEKIKLTGYDVDKIIYITTKEYKKRSEEVRRIPTTKTMDRKEGVWYLKNSNTPYTGKFIDYFFNGKIQGEGDLANGVINGIRTVYYQNGNKRYYYTYENGIQTGDSEEYFTNGKLKQKGSFVDKKPNGIWKRYYSTGALKDESTFINFKQKLNKEEEKYYSLQTKALDLMKEEDYKSAIKKLDDAEKLNNKVSDLYFYRGTAKLDDFNFDAALIDLDKAINLNPCIWKPLQTGHSLE